MPVDVLMFILAISRVREYPERVLIPVVEFINEDNAERYADFIGAVCRLKKEGHPTEEIVDLLKTAYENLVSAYQD